MKPKICLLIDDDEDEHELFGMALDDTNYSIELISSLSSIDALAMLKSTSVLPDFIFLDLNLPNLNGKECLKELKKIGHLQNIPVIIYSTSSYDKDIQESLELGAAHYVTKPPILEDLTLLLSSFFRRGNLPFFINKLQT